MFDKFRQTFNQTVSSTKFKADQLIKINNIQSEIGTVQREAGLLREQIANLVIELHQRGAIQAPELDPLIGKLEGLMAQVTEKQNLIEAIKAEPVPGQAPLPPAPPAPVPVPYPSTPAPVAATKACPNCQATVPAAVMFCPNCGFNFPPAVEEAPAPEPKTTRTCPSCEYEAPLTSAFCPNCGKPLNV